jgi:2-desacetyl-2-hydroxyethyl bacteriochlorophyllide A dehydrogenase
MRAMMVTDYGAPLQEQDIAQPGVPPGHVLVKILACGVCYTDVKISRGHMPFSADLELPHVPGHEVSGEVVEAAPETGFKAGDRVLVYNYWSCGRCPACLMGREVLCQNLQGWVGFTTPGGFQEYLAVRADRLLPVPESITPEQACSASCAFGTGYRAVVTRGGAEPGQTVVLIGVGGVGLHALQIAREVGTHILAVDINPEKLEIAQALGAVGTALAGEEAQALVEEFTQGQGADLVIDFVGQEDILHQAAQMTRLAGRVVGIGYFPGRFARIQTDQFVLRELEFIGSRYAQRYEIERVLSLMAAERITPVIDDILSLEDAEEALQRLERGEVTGRNVLRIG